MPNCSVHECTYNLSKEEGKYQSFPLPQDPDLKAKWVHSLKRAHFKPTKSTCICTIHFCEEDFVFKPKDSSGRPLKKRKLKDGAVPTLFMVPEPTPKTPPNKRRLNF